MLTRVVTIVFLALGAVLASARHSRRRKFRGSGFSPPQGRSLPLFDGFRQGLAELGYIIDGQNGKEVYLEMEQLGKNFRKAL